MAGFGIDLKDIAGGTEGLVGSSRGSSAVSAKETVARTAVDTTAAQAVQGIGSLFNQAVGAADSAIKRTIDTVSREQSDLIYKEEGVDDVTLIQGTSIDNEPIPADIGKAERNLMKLAQARNQGGVTDNAYWARVNSVSKQLRSRFPGHVDYIDQRISSVSGGNPQQAIMRNLLEQSNKSNTAALQAEKSYNDAVEKAAYAGYLPADYSRDKYPDEASLIKVVAPFAAAEKAREAERNAITIAKDRRELGKEEVTLSARRTAADASMKVINDATTTLGRTYLDIGKSISDISTGKKQGTPEELATIRNQFNTFRLNLNAELNHRLTQNYGGDLDAKGREEALSVTKNMMDTLEYAIANKDVGVLNLINNTNELYKQGDTQKLLDAFPEFRYIQALKETGTPGSVDFFLNAPDSNLRTVQARVASSNAILDIFGGGKTLDESLRVRRAVLGNEAGAVGFATLNKTVEALTSPERNLKEKKQAAYALFDTKNINFVSGLNPTNKQGTRAQHKAALDRMINPSVHKAMVSLRDQGEEELWKNYLGWTKNTFNVVTKQNVDTLVQAAAANNENFKVSWQGDKFVVAQTPVGAERERTTQDPRGGVPATLNELRFDVPKPIQLAVENLNSAINAVSIVSQDAGYNKTDFVQRVLIPQLPTSVFERPAIQGGQGTNEAPGGAGVDRLVNEPVAIEDIPTRLKELDDQLRESNKNFATMIKLQKDLPDVSPAVSDMLDQLVVERELLSTKQQDLFNLARRAEEIRRNPPGTFDGSLPNFGAALNNR